MTEYNNNELPVLLLSELFLMRAAGVWPSMIVHFATMQVKPHPNHWSHDSSGFGWSLYTL